MKASDIPAKFQIPFASSAAGANIRTVPVTSGDPLAASETLGFPPATMTSIGAGGEPPDGRDFNGLFFQSTGWDRWFSAGGPIVWDSTFSTNWGGYPNGAVVQSAVTAGLYFRCTADDNTTNPDAAGAGWSPFWLPRKGSTFKQLLSGSGTVAPTAGVVRWRVRMVAGGGGGATTGFNGAIGVATSLRDWTVNPGAGGIAQGVAGAGGTGGANGTGSLIMRQAGAQGQNAPTNYSTASGPISNTVYTLGGSTALGGAGTTPAPNSGAGGASAFLLDTTHNGSGGGGGGEFVEFVMDNPASAGYAYVVGPGGAAGAGPATAGATGAIYIEEIYP